MILIDLIQELLFPRKCVLCQKLLSREETDLCHNCRQDTSQRPKTTKKLPHIAQWYAMWYYEGSVRESLHRYKFRNRPSYSQSYGRLLAMQLSQQFSEGYDVITWVPISAKRKRKRGYDQVELLAESVSKELGIPAVAILKKVVDNPPQSGISGYAQRKANVLGVYECVVSPEGKRILLLDDILTTGATASECARMLLTAGAKQVYCAAIAAASQQS